MTKRKLFILTFLITTAIATLAIYLSSDDFRYRTSRLTQVSSNVFIASQLKPVSIRFLSDRGIRTIVDIRPDGEDPSQASSSEMEEASKAAGLAFHYIPVPHGPIPDSAVDTLTSVLKDANPPTLLYCRTGRRSVRLLALAEASRVNGPSLEEILKLGRSTGFAPYDLQEDISNRIANRNHTEETKH
jgi:uncharacterized protein (TIGR01244 family)